MELLNAIPEYAGAAPSYSAFTTALAASTVPQLAAMALLWAAAARFGGRARAAWGGPEPDGETLAGGERGKTAIEFVLLLPILLSILLLILQVAVLVQAKLVVSYAAFCAVRSAIVWIPADAGGEARNRVDLANPDSPKMETIRRAAALATVPISPHWSDRISDRTGTPAATQQMRNAADRIAHFFPSAGAPGVADSFALRMAYAFEPANTAVEIVPENAGQESGEFGDHDPITIRVTHRFYLGIPLANRLLGSSYGVGSASGFFYEISEQFTLLNEGEPLGA